MEDCLNIMLEDKIYRQRTPHSKIVVYDKNNEKIDILEDDLPEKLLEAIKIKQQVEESPSRYFEYGIYDNEVVIEKLTELNNSYVYIPPFIDGYPVTKIDPEILTDVEDKVKQIQLPETIKELKYAAFRGGRQLEYINIPKSINKISAFCFSLCYKLHNIDLSNIKDIDEHAFEECNRLTQVDASNVETIGDYAFSNCYNFTGIKLSNKLDAINRGVFAYCEQLKEIFLPDSINDIASRAFEECTSLEKVRFSKNIKFIGSMAFKLCESLKEFVAPEELLEIKASAFKNSGLERVLLNKKLKEIDLFAFSKCDKINYAEIYSKTEYSAQSLSQQMKYNLKIIKDEISVEEKER